MATKSGNIGTDGALAHNLAELNEKVRQLQAIMPGSDGGGSVKTPFTIGQLVIDADIAETLRRMLSENAEDPLYLNESTYRGLYPGSCDEPLHPNFPGSCQPQRLYLVKGYPVAPPLTNFYTGWEALHVFQDPASTPVPLAEGTGDFVTEGAGANVPVDVVNSSCWPIALFGYGVMVVNWSQTAGCAMTWKLKVHRNGVFLVQAPIGQISGSNTDPNELSSFSLAYSLGTISPGETWTFEVRPEYTAIGTTAFDSVTQVSAALRIFGGSVTS